MLIHECMECGTLSINRIAADDDASGIIDVFQSSIVPADQIQSKCEGYGIVALKANDMDVLYKQLYGGWIEVPVTPW